MIQKINDDLNEISKIIRGSALLSNYTQILGQSLLRDETPALWLKLWDGPEKVQSYLESLIQKATNINEAKDRLSNNAFYTSPLQLHSFLHPTTFLNALRQQTSRNLKKPMDSLRLVSSWNNSLASFPIKVSIDGILIQGSRFDGSNLTDSESSDSIFSKVPHFHLAWIPEVYYRNLILIIL